MKASMLGLLRKARTIRTSLGLAAGGRDEFGFEPDSGISREDQKDILREIEKVATKNRMAVSPEEFVVKAAKRGVLFPVLVNLVAMVLLVGGLSAFYVFFQRGETQLTQAGTGTITAEGKLIETFKKESEAKLLEKNQQINAIQGRLQEIDRQRQDLQANMDAKVRAKEDQLKTAMAAEIAAEKARLQKQGLSEQDINRRLAAMEAQKSAQSDAQLAAFRAQAETDKQKADENLKTLQAEFNANLAAANQERQQVLDESKKREADLQAQLEQKTREAASAQASSAQALAALQSRKEQEDLAAAQLVGLYSVVKADITAKDFAKAITGLQAIRDYVNSTDVAVLPSMQQRRDVDLFVVDSLTSYVQEQLSPANADTSSLIAAAGQISDVRAAVAQADAQARAGNTAEAEQLYQKALAVIPEIAHSYEYFSAKARDAEAARQQVLRAGLASAEAAFDAGNYPAMLAAYKDALGYLPESSAGLDKILSNILMAGSEQSRSRSQAEHARAAAPILAQADAALAQGRPADAISRYLTVLQRYPQSPQADSAARGIANASSALGDRADARLLAQQKALSAQVDTLQKQVASAQGSSTDLANRLSRAEGNAAALQKKIDALDAENQRLQAAADKAAADAANRQATSSQQAQGATSQDLAASRARLAALAASYQAYASREDPILAREGDQGLVDAKPYRDDFLSSKAVEAAFPGLDVRIERYDQGFLSAGRTNAIQEVLDVVIEMSKLATPDARASFLSGQLKAYGKDKDMTALLQGLQRLMK
jgi:hypothetical protein